jgi:ABC-type multidrug transport system fused ATPase/permease subunit
MVEAAPWPIELQDISLTRGGRPVLHDVSARFARATVTAIVGPSGAGKTSLLRCINRLEEPEAGTVLVEGADVRDLDPTVLRRRVGMIFQTPVLFEGGVRANLTYGIGHVTDTELERALEAASLQTSFLERESPALSVGQAQRVCIARALVRAPEALILDEPTSALDLKATERIEDLLVSLARDGLTIVVVTHNLDQARRIAEEAILLDGGRVVAIGPPDEVARQWPGGVA